MADLLRDPCGNLLPIDISLLDFVPAIPTIPTSLEDLLALLGIVLPTADAEVPCPIALDAAKKTDGA